MSVNSVWNSPIYQSYYNQAGGNANSAATAPNFTANNQDLFTTGQNTTNVNETKSDKSKVGIFAAVGTVAALGIATFAAYKTGKAKAGDNAKFSEILKTGFSEIGKKITDGVKKLFNSDGAKAAEQTGNKTTQTVTRELTANEKIAKEGADKLIRMSQDGASPDELKKAARQFQKTWHPDAHAGKETASQAEEVFKSFGLFLDEAGVKIK